MIEFAIYAVAGIHLHHIVARNRLASIRDTRSSAVAWCVPPKLTRVDRVRLLRGSWYASTGYPVSRATRGDAVELTVLTRPVRVDVGLSSFGRWGMLYCVRSRPESSTAVMNTVTKSRENRTRHTHIHASNTGTNVSVIYMFEQ